MSQTFSHGAQPPRPGALAPLPALLRRGARLRFSPVVSERLDLVRGLAAVVVLWNHLRAALFVEYAAVAPENATLATRAVYFLTGYGHAAVIVFFVLSGLLISASVLRAVDEGRWSWRWYASQRLTRLYVVLIPALVLGAAWDGAGLALFGAEGRYTGQPGSSFMDFSVADRMGAGTWAGNALFLQEIATTPFGSNEPLWSLSFEFWYYALFPVLLLAALAPGRLRQAGYLLGAAAIGLLVGHTIRLYFGVWLLGAAVAVAPTPLATRTAARRAALAACGLALGATLLAVRVNAFASSFVADVALGITFTALVWLLVQGGRAAPAEARPAGASWAGTLAGFSFTLYVLHMPLVIFLSAALTRNGTARWQPDLPHLAMLVPLTALVLAYAWAVARVTEHRTAAVRAVVERRLASLFASAPPRARPAGDLSA